MFIFVLQTIWLYISELTGKDLDAEVIFKFLLYFSPKLVPLVLPLTILLTSIMTFGNFAENYEFAAMKSSGISLQRAMRSLMFFIFGISLIAFFFANNVIPEAEFKSINLRKNIAQLKPAMAITENSFNDIGQFNIKVAEKSGDNGQYLDDVIIHQKGTDGSSTVIKAEEGELIGSTESEILSLVLKRGNYYNEVRPSDFQKRKKKPFAKSYFEEYTINIDLSEFNNIDLEEESYNSAHGMLKISELKESIDSFSTSYNKDIGMFKTSMYNRTGIENISRNTKPKDTIIDFENGILEHFNNYDRQQILGLAEGLVQPTKTQTEIKKQEFKTSVKQINKFEIALHEKYVLAVACVVLFFVGAPLGAIIRKGGMGLPIVVAILIFLTYHFIGIFAKNSAEDGSISPFVATWLSTLIMLPLGIFLTYRATTDQGLLAFDGVATSITQFLKRIGLLKSKEGEFDEYQKIVDVNRSVNLSEEEIEKYQALEDEKLIDLVKYYRKYRIGEDHRVLALKILDDRGIPQEKLKQDGNLYDKDYFELDRAYHSLNTSFTVTTIAFILFYVFLIGGSIVNFKFGLENTAFVLGILSLISIVVFYIFLFRMVKKGEKIDRILGEKHFNFASILLFMGMISFFMVYFQFRSEVKNLAGIMKEA